MKWVRKTFVQLFAVLLLISLVGLGGTLAFNHNLGSPEPLKGWLTESKIYDNIIADLISDAAKADPQHAALYQSQAVLQLADRTFTTDLVAQNVNAILDNNYSWLRGEISQPSFSIDLTKQREAFATQVGNYVTSRLSNLPVCSAAQLAQLQIPVDPLTITCRPATINAATEGQRVTQEVLSSSFLSKPVLNAQTLGQENGQPYYADLTELPRAFQIGQKLPIALGVISLLSVLAILYIAETRRRGTRTISIVLLAAGIPLIVSQLITKPVLDKIQTMGIQEQGIEGTFRQPYIDLVHTASDAVTWDMMIIGAVYALVALIIVSWLLASRNRTKANTTTPTPAPVKTEAPVDIPSQAISTPPPTKPARPARTMDIMSPAKPQTQPQKPITPANTPPIKRKPAPRRRLVQ